MLHFLIYMLMTNKDVIRDNYGIHGIIHTTIQNPAVEDVEKLKYGFPINQLLFVTDLQYLLLNAVLNVIRLDTNHLLYKIIWLTFSNENISRAWYCKLMAIRWWMTEISIFCVLPFFVAAILNETMARSCMIKYLWLTLTFSTKTQPRVRSYLLCLFNSSTTCFKTVNNAAGTLSVVAISGYVFDFENFVGEKAICI